MDVSQVGMLNNISLDVRRKRKIPYKKCKGRFTQKSLGVLNKSIIKGINNSKSFNESNLNRSQLVPLKDINSFLKKNKELALALEESRCAAKNFQKEAFKFQLELIEVRKSLSISHYALLKCSCQKDIGFSLNVDLLTHIKNSLEQTKQTLEKYVSTVILNKIKGVNTHKDGVNSSTQTEKIHMKNKRLQAHSSAHLSAYTERYRKENVSCVCSVVDKKKDIGLIDKETQKDFDVSIIEDRMKHLKNITYELKELSVGELKNTINDKAIKNEILKNKNVQSNFQSSRDLFQNNKKENERMPLSVIYDANITSKDSVPKKPLLRSLQEQKKVPAFQLYEDNPTGSNKENFQQIGIHSSDGKEKGIILQQKINEMKHTALSSLLSSGFYSNINNSTKLLLESGEQDAIVDISFLKTGEFLIKVGQSNYLCKGKIEKKDSKEIVEVFINGKKESYEMFCNSGNIHIFTQDGSFLINQKQPLFLTDSSDKHLRDSAIAPMTGSILQVCVKVGDTVESGDTVAVIYAMKLEHRVVAPYNGTVKEVYVQEGGMVNKGDELAKISKSE